MIKPTPRLAWGTWIATRAIIICWTVLVAFGPNDVRYYFERIELLGRYGPGWTLLEYPTPVIWLLQVPYVLGFGNYFAYLAIFALTMLALDYAFARSLARVGGTFAPWALLCWTVTLALLGPTTYLRFDLVTAVLAGWALLAVNQRRDVLGAGLVALGAAIKLWPALLWPALLVGARRRNWRITAWFWTIGGALALVSLVWGGWARLLTPLQWQANRGLQVESIFASVPMLQRLVSPDEHPIYLTTWQAWEIFGPGVDAWQQLTSVGTAVGLVAVAVCYAGWLRRPQRTMSQAALLMVFVVVLMIVTNKTFSPQYLLWLSGPLAVAVLGLGEDEELAGTVRRLALWIVAVSAATLIVYPLGYDHVVRLGWATPFVVPALVARNAAMLALLIWLGTRVWTFSRWTRRDARP